MKRDRGAHFAERMGEEQPADADTAGQDQGGPGPDSNGRDSSLDPGVRRFLLLLGLGALLVGLLPGGCAAGGLYWYSVNRTFMDESELIEGELAEYSEETKDGETMYRPIFSYTVDDKEHTYRASWRSSSRSYEEGDTIELYVRPDKPEEAMMNHWTAKYLGPVILGGSGLVLFTVCLGAAVIFLVMAVRG
ncbi:MAG: DUF3592 domain-containing protein [Candidatus Brocadiia bacterium]